MKPFRILLICTLFTLLPAIVHGQTGGDNYYVVVGAFAIHNNAIRWTERVGKMNFQAQYAMNTNRKLYYVYILSTTDKKKAYAFAIKMRAETDFKEAWVYNGPLGIEAVEEKPVIEEKPIIEEKPLIEEVKDTVVIEPVKIDSSLIKKPVEEKKPAGKAFNFTLISMTNGAEVMGEVHVYETEGATQYQSFGANKVVYLPPPRNNLGTYLIVVSAPGYQEVREVINYRNPGEATTGIGPNQEVIIPFEIVKAKTGDYIEFNRVGFFRNSAILTPESQNEVDGLAALMKENKKYKIVLHPHCNGKNSREVILMGESKNFFALESGLNKRLTLSAKDLTLYRGEVVRNYLISQGISGDRIKIKAEGGNVDIYPIGGTLAHLNDRVEVEIKKH